MDIGTILFLISLVMVFLSVIFFSFYPNKIVLATLIEGLIILILSIVSMAVGALSLNDLSKNDMTLVASGQYRIESDCFNRKSYYIGNVDLETFDKYMFTSTEPHIQLLVSSLKENSNYSLYRKDYFLGYNNILFCDN